MKLYTAQSDTYHSELCAHLKGLSQLPIEAKLSSP